MPHPRQSSVKTFWLISLGIHAAFLAALLWFAPVREIVFRTEVKEKPEVVTRGEELAEIIEQLRDNTAEKLAARVELLSAGQERMATNFETLNAYYQPFAEQQVSTAVARLDHYSQDTFNRLAYMRETAEEADKDKDPDPLLEAADKHTSRILSGMQEIKRGMHLVDATHLLDEQKKAVEAQVTANQHLGWLRQSCQAVARHQEEKKDLEAKVRTAEKQIEELKKQLAAKRQSLRQAEAAREEAVAAFKEENTEATRAERRKAAKRIKQLEKEVRRLEKTVEQKERQRQNMVQRREEATDKLAKAREQVPRRTHVCKNIQSGVYWKQKSILEKLDAHLEEWTKQEEPASEEADDEHS